MVTLVLSDPLDPLDRKDLQASQDLLELREIVVVLDLRDPADLKVCEYKHDCFLPCHPLNSMRFLDISMVCATA